MVDKKKFPNLLDPEFIMCAICGNGSHNSNNTVQCDIDPKKMGICLKNYDCGEFIFEAFYLVEVLKSIIERQNKILKLKKE